VTRSAPVGATATSHGPPAAPALMRRLLLRVRVPGCVRGVAAATHRPPVVHPRRSSNGCAEGSERPRRERRCADDRLQHDLAVEQLAGGEPEQRHGQRDGGGPLPEDGRRHPRHEERQRVHGALRHRQHVSGGAQVPVASPDGDLACHEGAEQRPEHRQDAAPIVPLEPVIAVIAARPARAKSQGRKAGFIGNRTAPPEIRGAHVDGRKTQAQLPHHVRVSTLSTPRSSKEGSSSITYNQNGALSDVT